MIRAITISGEIASGKSSLADALIALLPEWKRINTGQQFRDFSASTGKSIQQVSYLPDDIHRAFDTQQRKMLEIETNILVEGRLAGWVAGGLEGVLKVYCFAPINVRTERYIKRENVSQEKALEDIKFRDSKDVDKYKHLYGIPDYRSSAFYDLEIDTSGGSPIQLARIIIEKAGIHTNSLASTQSERNV